MGGIIGMGMAANPAMPIRRMVLNDVGPFIANAGQDRIGAYVGIHRHLMMWGMENYRWQVHARFGGLTAAQRMHKSAHGARQVEDGWTLGYDPRIADAFVGVVKSAGMWGI